MKFPVLQDLCRKCGGLEGEEIDPQVRDIVIRVLEWRGLLGPEGKIVDALVRQLGLFPYLDPGDLDVRDLVAYEAHRPLDLADEGEVVFHQVQAKVYRLLMSGENVILSAPTSFGKSLVIDALIASGKYRNCLIVVPTIALIDETRRRLSRFKSSYRVITHPSQQLGDRNLLILTQERVIDHPSLPSVDLFVIDEFYKLGAKDEGERANLLNAAFYKLWKSGAQFYLLGPNIESVPDVNINAHFIRTDYSTVASDVIDVSGRKDQRAALVEICAGLEEPTLIFCSSPQRARNVGQWLMEGDVGFANEALAPAASWIAENFHPEWLVGRALLRGIGIHHGRLPRSLAQYIVRSFNEGQLRFLICTSTLIEGVNTKAKNVVIFDNKIARRKYDYFTFNNIRGRGGRMFQHFVGRVFLFYEPPQAELPEVDIPILTQPEDAATSLLIHLDRSELTSTSAARLQPLFDQNVLDIETLRANAGVAPERQVGLAQDLQENVSQYHSLLAWHGFPTGPQLRATCDLIWKHFIERKGRQGGVSSASQLAFRLNQLRALRGDIKAVINQNVQTSRAESADEAVEEVLDFLRTWAGHNFPRFLMTLDRIQRRVFAAAGRSAGDYSFFAHSVEGLFLGGSLALLDEYGVPWSLAKRLGGQLTSDGGFDELLESVRNLDVAQFQLSPFERELLTDARSAM